MSEDYPESGPPRYELSAPFLRGAQKQHLDRMLNDIYADNIGQCMIHLWVEALQDFWTEHEASVSTACDLQAEDQLSEASTVEHSSAKCPDINTGDCIEDRKSVFQGMRNRQSCLQGQVEDICLLLRTLCQSEVRV